MWLNDVEINYSNPIIVRQEDEAALSLTQEGKTIVVHVDELAELVAIAKLIGWEL